jgi:hypothetical protein
MMTQLRLHVSLSECVSDADADADANENAIRRHLVFLLVLALLRGVQRQMRGPMQSASWSARDVKWLREGWQAWSLVEEGATCRDRDRSS